MRDEERPNARNIGADEGRESGENAGRASLSSFQAPKRVCGRISGDGRGMAARLTNSRSDEAEIKGKVEADVLRQAVWRGMNSLGRRRDSGAATPGFGTDKGR